MRTVIIFGLAAVTVAAAASAQTPTFRLTPTTAQPLADGSAYEASGDTLSPPTTAVGGDASGDTSGDTPRPRRPRGPGGSHGWTNETAWESGSFVATPTRAQLVSDTPSPPTVAHYDVIMAWVTEANSSGVEPTPDPGVAPPTVRMDPLTNALSCVAPGGCVPPPRPRPYGFRDPKEPLSTMWPSLPGSRITAAVVDASGDTPQPLGPGGGHGWLIDEYVSDPGGGSGGYPRVPRRPDPTVGVWSR